MTVEEEVAALKDIGAFHRIDRVSPAPAGYVWVYLMDPKSSLDGTGAKYIPRGGWHVKRSIETVKRGWPNSQCYAALVKVEHIIDKENTFMVMLQYDEDVYYVMEVE